MATLQDALLAVGDVLRDNLRGTTTTSISSPANQMHDSRLAGGLDNRFAASQVVFLGDGVPARTGLNPQTVTGSSAGDGILTLSDVWTPGAGVPVGVPYALIGARGQRFPYDARVAAIQAAVLEIEPYVDVIDKTQTITAGMWEGYSIPATLDSVVDVYLVLNDGTNYGRSVVRQGLRAIYPDTWTLDFDRAIPIQAGWTIEYHGRKAQAVPTALTDTIAGDFRRIVLSAVEQLLASTSRKNEQMQEGMLAQRRFFIAASKRLPGEIFRS